MSLQKILLPDLGEGVTEGEILKIQVKEGESIVMDQILIEVMTDKASMEIPSSIAGLVKKIEVCEGDIVSIGSTLLVVKTTEDEASSDVELSGNNANQGTDASEANQSSSKNLKTSSEQRPATSRSDEELLSSAETEKNQNFTNQDFALAAPATRKLAIELGLNLKDISKDKITREDLLNYVKKQIKKPHVASSAPLAEFEEDKRSPVKGIQRLMFESMTLSKSTIPHFTIGEQAQVNYLVQLRTEMKNRLEQRALKVGYLPFFIKALIPVIQEFPIFNAAYDSSTKELVFKKNLNVGFAVDSPQGLLVPVIKNVQNKSLLEIIEEVFEKATKTREASIERENLKGAGLTLTNLGGIGGMYGTPIIQAPELAILGIYKMFKQVVKSENNTFEEKTFMNFSITCDHRFIDGATAARFLKSFVQKVEEPSLLLL